MMLADGRSLSQTSTVWVVFMAAFGLLGIGFGIWGIVDHLRLRRRGFHASATVIDISRPNQNEDTERRRGPFPLWSGWVPEVEFTGPDGRSRRVNAEDVVMFRPVLGGTVRVICEPDDPSYVHIRSFSTMDHARLLVAFIVGSVMAIVGAVELLRRFAG